LPLYNSINNKQIALHALNLYSAYKATNYQIFTLEFLNICKNKLLSVQELCLNYFTLTRRYTSEKQQ